MAHYKKIFKKILVDFIYEKDHLLSMLEWTAQCIMEIEAESRIKRASYNVLSNRVFREMDYRVKLCQTREFNHNLGTAGKSVGNSAVI